MATEEYKQLLDLCRTGHLYAIEEWIRVGKTIHPPVDARRTPLDIAVKTGFHSLVELLAKNTTEQEDLDYALEAAVDKQRLDLVEVLIEHGADIKSFPFVRVLWNWHPGVIRLFIKSGADVLTGNPFAHAFSGKIKTALGPYLDLKRSHPEWASKLQEQADMALRYFCKKEDMKWISLMTWAGANPHSVGPDMDYDEDDVELYTSAIRETCWRGNLGILKMFDLTSEHEDMGELLCAASSFANLECIQYLLEKGADPNGVDNSGDTALYRCLMHLDWDKYFPSDYYHPKRDKLDTLGSQRTMKSVETLVAAGARWDVRNKSSIGDIRRKFYAMDSKYVRDFVKLLVKYKASSEEALVELLRTKTMRDHVAVHWSAILEIVPALQTYGKIRKQ